MHTLYSEADSSIYVVSCLLFVAYVEHQISQWQPQGEQGEGRVGMYFKFSILQEMARFQKIGAVVVCLWCPLTLLGSCLELPLSYLPL